MTPPCPRSAAWAQRLYRSTKWKTLKDKVLKANHYECQRCKARGRITRAVLVHHEVPVRSRPDLALVPYLPDGTMQLVPLCFECHEEIERERGNRPKTKREPLTPEWW
jgi:5-methylcytosine-specific restriction protein A